MLRIGRHDWRGRDRLRTGSSVERCLAFASDYLAGWRKGRIVKLEVHQDGGAPSTRMGWLSVSGARADR